MIGHVEREVMPKARGTSASKQLPRSRGLGSETPKRTPTWRKHLEEEAAQHRLAWLRRPLVYTAAFEDPPENITELPDRIQKRRRRQAELTKQLGWSSKRLALFKKFVVAYRKAPTLENYILIRRRFPEVEIQIARFGGIDQLFALEDEFQRQGVDPLLVAGALDALEPNIDDLSLCLAECLVARSKLPRDGPGHIVQRRNAISDATVNYLIAVMLESLQRYEASLVVLVRASSGLLCLRQDEFLVADDLVPQCSALPGSSPERLHLENRSPARDLNDSPVHRDVAIDRRSADHAIRSDHGRLDGLAGAQIDHERHNTTLDEVDGMDCIAGLEQHRLLRQIDHLEMRQQRGEIARVKRRQKCIRCMGGLGHTALLPLGRERGRVSRPLAPDCLVASDVRR